MRSLWLLSATLAVPLLFASPAEAAVGPPCCRNAAATTPLDPSKPPHKELEEESRGVLDSETVKSPDERMLEASAEAPIPEEAELASAIGIPLEEPLPAAEPGRLPIVAAAPAPLGTDTPIDFPGCCRLVAVTQPAERSKPPHNELEEEKSRGVLDAEMVRSPDDRALEARAEAPIPEDVKLASAIGSPREVPPAAPDPDHMPIVATAKAQAGIALLVLLAIALGLRSRRRPRPPIEPAPVARRLPPSLRPDAAPLLEPAPVVGSEARRPIRELEPA